MFCMFCIKLLCVFQPCPAQCNAGSAWQTHAQHTPAASQWLQGPGQRSATARPQASAATHLRRFLVLGWNLLQAASKSAATLKPRRCAGPALPSQKRCSAKRMNSTPYHTARGAPLLLLRQPQSQMMQLHQQSSKRQQQQIYRQCSSALVCSIMAGEKQLHSLRRQ